MTLKQLIYYSELEEGVRMEDIDAIVQSAQKKNERLGLTGFFAFNSYFFLQLLEGGQKNLNTLYSDIINDQRHKNVSLLGYSSIARRNFPDWGMSYCALTKANKRICFRFMPSDEFDPRKLDSESARDLLLALAASVNGQP